MSGESRTELLKWVNELLQLNYTKVEQLGSGAAYCQILDSVFLDLPMSRVNFNASKEYEYLNNFKVLQSAFQKHKIQKPIPVDRLTKCKFQDNLEFFQWIRKFWLENRDEAEYDPLSRRKATAPSASGTRRSTPSAVESRRAPSANGTASTVRQTSAKRVVSGTTSASSSSVMNSSRRVTSSSSNTSIQSSTLPKVRSSAVASSRSATRSTSTSEIARELESAKNDLNTLHLLNQDNEETIKALEIERNFYYNKLRSIEVVNETVYDMINNPNQQETPEEQTELLKAAVLRIHDLLYMLADGFEVPGQESDANYYDNQNLTADYSQTKSEAGQSVLENGNNMQIDMDIDADTF
ncbi:hypothetical protein WICPIJ_000518 [Wickerhamomyces pijperi]|uniref:Calponin-homology (CH) domain-containing protein n=1 Tax=Wickerhamomyces pijperi TaxID=599730 RepID=A0A9P8TRN9_WICPI|nr:hypothetical protein WICPIJ_000518 [Wickerhamomyces pijperi]